MTRFKRLCLSYLFASLASATVGGVAAALYTYWARERVTWWVFSASIWLVIVGLPSLFAAADDLLRTLGKKDKPFISATNFRPLSIDAQRGQTFLSLLPVLPTINGQRRPPQTTIESELYDVQIEVGDYVLDETFLLNFLRTAWSRQRNRKPALSRRWWVEGSHLDYGEYQAVIEALTNYGLIAGRKHGRSGKLRYPPLKSMSRLRELVS